MLEAVDCGATEVCLQGGIHPDFDGDYYLSVAPRGEGGRAADPRARLHRARGHRGRAPPRHAAARLPARRPKDAGLATLPGTAAEILDDEVRAVICPDKIDTEEWLDAHRTAHSVGLRSNVTIMFGTVERPEHVARHLVRTRALQKETGGFTEFVPLPFVHMATPIFLQQKARKGPTMREVLLMHAVGRIAYRGWIDNVQVSWVKTGVPARAQALQAGCNDLGGTLMDENISRAAGASHGQELDESELQRHRRAARPSARAAHHALRAHAHRGPSPAAAAGGGRGRPGRGRGVVGSRHLRRREERQRLVTTHAATP